MHSFKLLLHGLRIIVTSVRPRTHIARRFLIKVQRASHHRIILFLYIEVVPRKFSTMRTSDETLLSFLIDIRSIAEPAQHDWRELFVFLK